MTLLLEDLALAVVDDNPAARGTMTEELEEFGIEVDALDGPFHSKEAAYQALRMGRSQGLVCDYQLDQHDYAQFNGAEFVAYCYDQKFPGVLVTRYSSDMVTEIRPWRHLIPALLTPRELTDDVEHVQRIFDKCMREVLLGEFSPDRRPWQTLLCVENVDAASKNALVIIPAWDAPGGDNGVKLPFSMFPANLLPQLKEQARFFGMVNLGAAKHEDVYIKDIVFKG